MNDFRIKDLTMIRCISIVSLILLKSNFRAYAAPPSNIQPNRSTPSTECDGVFINSTHESIVRDNKPTRCPNGQFNDLALSTDECISCFCFGATTACKSANSYIFEVLPPVTQFSVMKVRYEESNSLIDDFVTLRTSILSGNGFQIKDVLDNFRPPYYPYLSLPSTYNGNQLKSYGGYIKYRVTFDESGTVLPLPLIIISGNGNKIFYNGTEYYANNGTQRDVDQNYNVNVRIFYGAWFKEGRGSQEGGDISSYTPPSLASREEIMMILANVENILLKIQYTDGRIINTVISNFKLDSAGASNTGLGKAAFVEECSCPAGYSGLSCERCAPGYTRRVGGLWLGQCYRQEPCPGGTYGDPSRNIPCKPCPCPLSNPTNQFGRTCYLDDDGEPTCYCPPEYGGRRCQYCASGYVGNPLIPGDYCKKIGDDTICDGQIDCTDGSDEESCDWQTSSPWKEFICKDGTPVGNETICDLRNFIWLSFPWTINLEYNVGPYASQPRHRYPHHHIHKKLGHSRRRKIKRGRRQKNTHWSRSEKAEVEKNK